MGIIIVNDYSSTLLNIFSVIVDATVITEMDNANRSLSIKDSLCSFPPGLFKPIMIVCFF